MEWCIWREQRKREHALGRLLFVLRKEEKIFLTVSSSHWEGNDQFGFRRVSCQHGRGFDGVQCLAADLRVQYIHYASVQRVLGGRARAVLELLRVALHVVPDALVLQIVW